MIYLHLLACRAYWSRGALGRCVSLLVVLLLAGCASASTGIAQATPTVRAVSTVKSQATPPTATAGPSPVTRPLAAPPQNCPLKSPPQEMHLDSLGMNNNVRLIGGGRFWIYDFFYQSVVHMGQFNYQQWPMLKIVVEVGPNYDQPVTLRLQNRETGALVWWTDAQTPPQAATQVLVLNPQTDTEDVGSVPGVPDVPHGSPRDGWKEWGIFPVFSVAGCYTLQASWSGGSWQSTFAVGN